MGLYKNPIWLGKVIIAEKRHQKALCATKPKFLYLRVTCLYGRKALSQAIVPPLLYAMIVITSYEIVEEIVDYLINDSELYSLQRDITDAENELVSLKYRLTSLGIIPEGVYEVAELEGFLNGTRSALQRLGLPWV